MIVQILMLPIPLASLRATLLIHSILPGLLIYRMFARNTWQMMTIVLNLLLLYKIFAYASAENGAFLQSTAAMVGQLSLFESPSGRIGQLRRRPSMNEAAALDPGSLPAAAPLLSVCVAVGPGEPLQPLLVTIESVLDAGKHAMWRS